MPKSIIEPNSFSWGCYAIFVVIILSGHFDKDPNDTFMEAMVRFGWHILIAMPFGLLGMVVQGIGLYRAQEELDLLAEDTLKGALENAHNGTIQKITLYLRPFDLTKKLQYSVNRPTEVMSVQRAYLPKSRDLETIIAESLLEGYPMIALGTPGEHVGAGRVVETEAKSL